jgi:hypothetical protein
MDTGPHSLLTEPFLTALKTLVKRHHSIYPRIPPRDIFFESLVEQAFRMAGFSKDQIVLSPTNRPQHDMTVGTVKMSIKSETGKSTKPALIKLTKLCTTETGEWTSAALIQHALSHLERYDLILMLRAIWHASAFHYQLLDIPLQVLRRLASLTVVPVGRRPGRQSLGAPVLDGQTRAFRVHFDGADGKCQVHDLRIELCQMLLEWDQPRKD